jgi:hypothetical protein
MRLVILVSFALFILGCVQHKKDKLTLENIPEKWTMLYVDDADTLQYKDCNGMLLGVEILKSDDARGYTLIFTWSLETDTFKINELQFIKDNEYLLTTNKDNIHLNIKNKREMIAAWYSHNQGENSARLYIDNKKSSRYKLTDFECEGDAE